MLENWNKSLGARYTPGACAVCVMEGWRGSAAAGARLQLIAQLCLNILTGGQIGFSLSQRTGSSNMFRSCFFHCFPLLPTPHHPPSSAPVTREWSGQLRIQPTAAAKLFHASINESGGTALKELPWGRYGTKSWIRDMKPQLQTGSLGEVAECRLGEVCAWVHAAVTESCWYVCSRIFFQLLTCFYFLFIFKNLTAEEF